MQARAAAVVAAVLLLVCSGPAAAVDKSKFRECKDTGFCKRYRKHQPTSHFHVNTATLRKQDHGLTATLEGGPQGSVALNLEIRLYDSGVSRVRVTEAKTRWQPPDVVLESQLKGSDYTWQDEGSSLLIDYAKGTAATGGKKQLRLHYSPFKVDMLVGGEVVMTANDRNRFHFEHSRTRDGHVVTDDMDHTAAAADSQAAAAAGDVVAQPEGKKIVDYNEHGHAIYEDGTTSADATNTDPETTPDAVEAEPSTDQWEESWGGHTDSKPNGPQSVGIDVTFAGAKNVFGIPEHASKFSLKATDGSQGAFSEPYRLYNLDVFEYELDVPMALYGSIPLMVAHTPANGGRTVAAFWFNPTETFIDVDAPTDGGTQTHWISEAGVADLFFVPGPSSRELYSQYAQMTGYSQLPPLFSLGYHQCRWNYRDEADVKAVDAKFEEHNFPYDVIWLDIEHTNGKRYFTWDKNLFPQPKEMIDDIASRGRRVVTIVDPHLKRDGGYNVHTEAQAASVYVRNKDGGEFDGWCWPGSSSYVDFTNPRARSWWADRFALDKYDGSTLDLFTWNDMNEPSVFNGPEVTMKKDSKAIDGQEHREWHNLYGFYMQMATCDGLSRRSPGGTHRPFLLSRSFFAGSQRYGAIWTGDNAGRWDHLQIAAPMLLSFNVAGLPFIGSDTGGFFGNPDAELMTRWFQASAYHPFFRGHAHHDAKRREPWVFDEPHTSRMRTAVTTRYQLLPLWYTLFHESHTTGMPVMRALWMHYPDDAAVVGVEDAFLVGSDLLVKPVTQQGQNQQTVYFPGPAGRWYDVDTHKEYAGKQTYTVEAPIDKTPAYQRGGSIVPRQMRVRRSSKLMVRDPYTLVVALDANNHAVGDLYVDDFHTFAYQSGAFVHRRFTMSGGVLSSVDASNGGSDASKFSPENTVERIVVLGLNAAPQTIRSGDRELHFAFNDASKTLTIRKPQLRIVDDWQVQFQ